MQTERRSEIRADPLQPERLVEFSAGSAAADCVRDSAFHDKAVADVPSDLSFESRASDVLSDRNTQVLSQHAVAFDVFLLDWTLPDRNFGVLLQPLA